MNLMRSNQWPDKKYRAHCQKSDYLRDLDPGKKMEIYCLSQQLFTHCLNAGIGETGPCNVKPYIPGEIVSSETAWAVCYSLAAAEVCADYPLDFQDQDLIDRFLEQLSNVGFNTEGDPIAVIEDLQTPELKHKHDYLKALAQTGEWNTLHRLRGFLFDYLVSRWLGWKEDIVSEQLAQYICQQIAGTHLFSDYPTTTQDRYVEQYFLSLAEKAEPFNVKAISFDKAIVTWHQWMNGEKGDLFSSPPPTIPEPFVEMIKAEGWEMLNSKQLWVWMAQFAIAMIDDGSYPYGIADLSAVGNLVKSGNLSDKDCLQMANWCVARLQTLKPVDNNSARKVA